LEGSYAFQTSMPPSLDITKVNEPAVGQYFSTLTHELVHTWLPIRLFAVDDLWLKEGVTSYYGDVLAARAGWLTHDDIRRLTLRYQYMVYGEIEIEKVPLSDPQLWYEEYTSEAWRRVTYERGFAVTVLLDVLLRESTENRHSLDDVMKSLFAEHLRGTINRHELLRAIYDSTGVYATKFFAKYVDSTTAPSVDEVQAGLEKLIEFGAYSGR
ncbi:MAG: putative metalloprotease with PDZ domain, partial [Candidatus Krumholzibacteriia bacterium]